MDVRLLAFPLHLHRRRHPVGVQHHPVDGVLAVSVQVSPRVAGHLCLPHRVLLNRHLVLEADRRARGEPQLLEGLVVRKGHRLAAPGNLRGGGPRGQKGAVLGTVHLHRVAQSQHVDTGLLGGRRVPARRHAQRVVRVRRLGPLPQQVEKDPCSPQQRHPSHQRQHERQRPPGIPARTVLRRLHGRPLPFLASRGPVPGISQHVDQPLLFAAGDRVMVIEPPHLGRQRHEDGLRAPLRLQAEHRAPVVHEVELHVAPTADLLPETLRLGGGDVLAALGDGQVRRQERAARIHHERQLALQVLSAQILEEQPAHPPALLAVAQVEVLVAGALEARVVGRIVPVAHRLQRAVEVHRVLIIEVVGRQVRAAPEPRLGPLVNEAEVGVDGGHVRVARVEHQRQPSGPEIPSLSLKLVGECLLQLAVHHRGVHPGLLQHRAALQHPRAPAASARALPGILPEAPLAIQRLQPRADLVLQLPDELRHPHLQPLHLLHVQRHRPSYPPGGAAGASKSMGGTAGARFPAASKTSTRAR
ncbi:hypothetical protein STIAU_8744 [Stigmatella aurantiaca DW4/3-1]|uniref:Uncharacterized protein n=1 Tax=Stigmatella aurantiaca (strain DW4/3-1) TaxID=378806 RepID=Q08UM8_STIAD|nr:hypothetical protein STIAU_8744 [Stigmatella aurantiaca DW4/3-1]